ncbi:MAG: hypothetical protein WC815_23855 [Vicinamibacterales bacterium]|jgi:hypothetical protein
MKATTRQRLIEAREFCDEHGLEGDAMTGHLMTFARVDEQTALRFMHGRLDNRGLSNPHKIARKAVRQAAEKQGLREKGEASFYSKKFRGLLAKVFPKLRAKYAALLARWEKHALKKWAQQEHAARHDPDYAAMEKARAKIQRKHERERARMRFAEMAAGDPAKG